MAKKISGFLAFRFLKNNFSFRFEHFFRASLIGILAASRIQEEVGIGNSKVITYFAMNIKVGFADQNKNMHCKFHVNGSTLTALSLISLNSQQFALKRVSSFPGLGVFFGRGDDLLLYYS